MKKRRKQSPKNKDMLSDLPGRDMLSDLPDCLLLHILSLSFSDARDAARTCLLLSTRWKHLWKHILILRSYHFRTFEGNFTEYVNWILSRRDASTAVNTLEFWSSDSDHQVKPDLLERIVRYSISHNVNRVHIFSPDLHDFPFSLFSCLSLTYLDIGFSGLSAPVKFPNSMNLPSLTYLTLRYFCFCDVNAGRVEPFSTYKRLNTLILHHCLVADEQTLCISSTTLLSLSIYTDYDSEYYLYIDVCAPNLCTFAFTGRPILKPSGSNLFSLEDVNIELHIAAMSVITECPLIILNWLIKLVNIKSLTVSASTLQVLSTIPDILKVTMPPSWYNLKSLKVKGMRRDGIIMSNQSNVNFKLAGGNLWKVNAKLRKAIKALFAPYWSMPCAIVEFLLQNSPSAKIDLVGVKY